MHVRDIRDRFAVLSDNLTDLQKKWMAALKSLDQHYQNQLSMQAEEHCMKMHILKLQLENQLNTKQSQFQQRLACHHSAIQGYYLPYVDGLGLHLL